MAADDKSVSLSIMDRLWIKRSLELQRTSLERSKGREMPGSDILTLRDKEIASINSILAKLS